jgi:hypothetical protein
VVHALGHTDRIKRRARSLAPAASIAIQQRHLDIFER